MKKLVLFATCMATLCIQSATLEEARQLVREYVELYVNLPPGYNERTRQMYPAIQELDREILLALCCEMMAERFDDPNPKYVNTLLAVFESRDIYLGSPVNEEVVNWVRRVWREKRGGYTLYDLRRAEWYMSFKGDAGDLDDMMMIENQERLAARVAGTNIISRSIGERWSTCIPSVANTGPQALYVDAILRQYWENMEEKNVANIPDELITIVVWFDEDGNPVCNVDLAKYGLTMPELDVPNRPKGKPKAAAAPPPPPEKPVTATRDETPPITIAEDEPNEATHTPSRPWLYVGILAFLSAVGTVFWRVRRKR